MEKLLANETRVEPDRASVEPGGNAALERALTHLAHCAEVARPGARCSIHLVDETKTRLVRGAAPSMPGYYADATDDIVIGPNAGTCALAAGRLETVITENVATDRDWPRELRAIAQQCDLRSCWSEPIFGPDLDLVGTIAMFLPEPHRPGRRDLEVSETIAHVAGIAIDRQRRGEPVLRGNARASEIFWLLNTTTDCVVYVSPAYETVWGAPSATLRDDPQAWINSIHVEDRERIATAFARHAHRGRFDVEYRIVRPDGGVRWIRDRAFPIRDDEREVRLIAGLAEDVTASRDFELSLEESETSFRQLAENIGAVFWLTDWKAREMLYVSPTWDEVWGQPVECLFGDSKDAWADNIHDEDRQRVVATFARDAEAGRYDVDFRVVRSDGAVRWLHERCFPIRDDDGTIYRMAGVAQDITERKNVERELEAARDEIEACRRAQVESLTSELLLAEENERRRLSQDLHDGMNQLITLALLKLSQLRSATEGHERELTTEIEELIEKAGRSIRSLTYQLSPPILHDLGFEPAIEWLTEDIQTTYGLEVELIEPEGASPLGERARILLFRAVRELLINVAKHARAKRACVHLKRRDDLLSILVEDDGIAFDCDAVGKRGTGLYAIRERLDNLGGQMKIESTPGRGTRVTLVVPFEAN